MGSTLIYIAVFLLATPWAYALDSKQLSEVLSVNESLTVPQNRCPDLVQNEVPFPSCPGQPEVQDPQTPKPEEVISIDDYNIFDSLLHAKCPQNFDFNTCVPFPKNTKFKNIQGGMITSFARYGTEDLQSALRADKRVSEFVSSTGGAFHGLCDISFYSDYGIEQIRRCLKMPGMIGVGELNINGEGSFSKTATTDKDKIFLGHKGQAFKRLIEIAAVVQNSGGGTISTHLANSYDPAAPQSEVDALIELANRFPKVNFILLHSGLFHGDGAKSFGLDGLKKIGNYYKNNSTAPRNIWTDLSGILGDLVQPGAFPDRCTFLRRQAELASAWRAFGSERVIFGSDDGVSPSGFESKDFVQKSVVALISNPFLTEKEKKNILSENIKRLFAMY